MPSYLIKDIVSAVGGKLIGHDNPALITHLCIDSRRVTDPHHALFIALPGKSQDGHHFIQELFAKEVTVFLVKTAPKELLSKATFIVVSDTLVALQRLAAFHRQQFQLPVIGITGSNGKTIVKEWLFQLLYKDYDICRSPKSYNSQIGVPLSIWQLQPNHTLGIFEAGISTINEMEKLAQIIQPTLGILTNIGPAHDAGFLNKEEKVIEKINLFKGCQKLIFCSDYPLIAKHIPPQIKKISWGRQGFDNYQIVSQETAHTYTSLTIKKNEEILHFTIPFSDDAYVEDCIHCIITMLEMGYSEKIIAERILTLRPLSMRMELKYGLNDCVIIDDSYSADLLSLKAALGFFKQQIGKRKPTLILSTFSQTGLDDRQLIHELKAILLENNIQKLIGVGKLFTAYPDEYQDLNIEAHFFENTKDVIKAIEQLSFFKETILIKGARKFKFETLIYHLLGQSHRTVLEIDLNALSDNYDVFKSYLKPSTGIIPMVKAFSYGSGSSEIAKVLEDKGVEYLAVAYVDEGVKLREGGIRTKILVMNPATQDIDKMVEYRLEPEIYQIHLLKTLIHYLDLSEHAVEFPIHIKLETGMNRLGFQDFMLDELIETLQTQQVVRIASVFSHLAASDESDQDHFTLQQFHKFELLSSKILQAFSYPIFRHILNSSGIVRFSEYQYDFVRLGIGLYGIDSSHTIQSKLEIIGTLKTTISQIKFVPEGETIGYGRKGRLTGNGKIAIIAIGYADGYDRRFSNGVGEVWVKGQPAKIVGNVCMDMCMVDVTHIPDVMEGDEVEIYGKNISIIEAASKIGTIPYELLTKISRRVRRVYFWN